MYRTLRADEVLKTADHLTKRVEARFPESGLFRVATELARVARETHERCITISRPNVGLRVAVGLLMVVGITGIFAIVVVNVRMTDDLWDLATFAAAAEALLADLVFLGAGIAFLVTLETRFKRQRALAAVIELRALAHIVDMHQLTKDPETLLTPHPPTAVSPVRNMTAFELIRYLDYCSEMLALIAKIGALYVQSLPDAQALGAVDELEHLTTGLSRKIWQKIMILDRYAPRARGVEVKATAP